MNSIFNRFSINESGSTAVEYSFITGFLAMLLIAAITNFSGNMSNNFDRFADMFATPTSGLHGGHLEGSKTEPANEVRQDGGIAQTDDPANKNVIK